MTDRLGWRLGVAADAGALAALVEGVSESEASAYLATAECYVACTETGELMACAGVRAVDTDRMQGRLVVNPALSAGGPVATLLDWQAAKARAAGCTQLEVLMPASSSANAAILQTWHWDVHLPLWEMERPTDDRFPVSDLPAGLTAVPYNRRYQSSLYRCYRKAYADQRLVRPHSREAFSMILSHATFQPDFSTLAIDQSDVVAAFVLCCADSSRLDIGPVGTVAKWRRQGVSSALVATTLGAAQANDIMQVAALTVDGASPTGAMRVYTKLGFGVVRRWHLYRKIL